MNSAALLRWKPEPVVALTDSFGATPRNPETKMTEPIIPNPAQPILPVAELEPVMSEEQFCQWMVTAKPSDRIQIHVGHIRRQLF